MKLILIQRQGQVSQSDLENLLTLDAQIRRLQGLRETLSAGVLSRVVAGAEVEPGPRSIDLVETYSKATRRQRLEVR